MNFPEIIWSRLKVWATRQASLPTATDLDACKKQVEFIVSDVAGRRSALPVEVVNFYAAETLQMIEQLIVELSQQEHCPAE